PNHTEVQVVPIDAIVIRRDELPTARVLLSGHLGTIHGHHSAKLSANWHRDLAAHHLALADYVDAHPPVDEAQVKALAELVDELQEHGKAYYEDPREFAEDLVKRGVRVGDA